MCGRCRDQSGGGGLTKCWACEGGGRKGAVWTTWKECCRRRERTAHAKALRLASSEFTSQQGGHAAAAERAEGIGDGIRECE